MSNKPMLSVELLPCPFCGSNPKLPDGYGTQYEIECNGCGQATSSIQICDLMTIDERVADMFNNYRYGEEFIERAKLAAIESWNNRVEPSAKHQGEPEFQPDAVCLESDGCPTEGAVLKRFWRDNQPDSALCEFYEADDFPSLVRELVGHVTQLQEAAKRNVKPWEDTFPPTLLPAYIARVNAEQPAPVAVVMPEPYSLAMFQMISGFESVTPEQFDLVWSACRAEVARLNGVSA